jgi:hypothetical protein
MSPLVDRCLNLSVDRHCSQKMAAAASSSEVPWEVRDTEFKGKAAYSLHDYKEGDCIYKEKPLVWVPFHWPFNPEQVIEVDARVAELSYEDQEVFYDCANAYEELDGEAPSIAAGIFYTNSFDMCGAHHGESCCMYPNIARLNHSCEPNTRQEYCAETMRLLLYADKDIAIGEQLTDSYTDITQPVDVRRKALEKWYKFHCDCDKCEREAANSVSSSKKASNTYPNLVDGHQLSTYSSDELLANIKKEAIRKKKADMKIQKQREAEAFAKAKAEASARKKKEKQKKETK